MSTMIENVVTAEYDAEHNTLRLEEPLEGVRDGDKVRVHVHVPVPEKAPENASENVEPERGLTALRGLMSDEQADEMQAIINEMFPPWND